MLKEALFYRKYEDKIKCYLCPHNCIIDKGKYGICSARRNEDGVLRTINYGEITAISMDPIEKKPLYHFLPGKDILSVGSFGCNLSCGFCQNYSIAHYRARSEYISSDKLVDHVLKYDDNIGIAFTYNEPTISYEYIYDVARELKNLDSNMKLVLITNGYMELEPLEKLLPYIDAMNIDLKSFQDEYYKKICGAGLDLILRTIEKVSGQCHLEITSLLVNGLNDSKGEIENIASFIGGLNKNIPLHLSRYFPTYKMNLPATPIEHMIRARHIAKKYLNHVYLGNLAGFDNSTSCPNCGELIIERDGYRSKIYMNDNRCGACGHKVEIVIWD